MNKEKKWIKIFIITISFLMLIIISFNYTMNPFNIFDPSENSTFSRYKRNINSDRMTEFYELKFVKPKTLIVGSSRSGYFKNDLIAPYVKKPIFNLSLAGSSVYEQSMYIKYAIKHLHVDTIVWSLDFYGFNPEKKPYNGYKDKRLTQKIYLDDYLIGLMSYRTFERSIKTLKDNMKQKNKKYSYLCEQNQYIAVQGQSYTRKEILEHVKKTLKEYETVDNFLKSQTFKDPSSIDKKLQLVQEVVNLCKTEKTNLNIYTSPVYKAHLDLIKKMQLSQTFIHWKQGLAHITPYTDFCYKNDITNNIMKFRDSSHTISDTGILIFAKIFHDSNSSIDFGRYIE